MIARTIAAVAALAMLTSPAASAAPPRPNVKVTNPCEVVQSHSCVDLCLNDELRDIICIPWLWESELIPGS